MPHPVRRPYLMAWRCKGATALPSPHLCCHPTQALMLPCSHAQAGDLSGCASAARLLILEEAGAGWPLLEGWQVVDIPTRGA